MSNLMNATKGYTPIELLVVLIIIGVLSSIALPTFLKQRDQARQSEAKAEINAYAKLQLIRFSRNDDFVVLDENYKLLEADIDRQTSNYSYGFLPILGADGKEVGAVNRAVPKRDLRAFVSIVGRVFRGNQESRSTVTIRCQSKSATSGLEPGLEDIDFVEGEPSAGGGSIGCKGRAVRYRD